MSSTALLINDLRLKLQISISISFIIFGTMGNLLNIILFRKRTLWTLSPCVPYLFAASFSNLFNIYAFIPFRVLSGFQITSVNTFPVPCKLQIYFYYISFGLSTWLMVGCCADRFFSSSLDARIRRFSNIRITKRMIFLLTFLICVGYSQVLYCYNSNLVGQLSVCNVIPNFCTVIDVMYYLLVQTVGPPILMITFGIGTYLHIKERRRLLLRLPVNTELTGRNAAIATNAENPERNSDKHILPMLTIQVIIYLVCSIPLLATKIYQMIPLSIVKSDVRIAGESLFFNLSVLFSLGDKVFSFYIYTLSSKFYRKELIKLVRQCRPHRRIAAQN
ncbi:unnamed protein product [Adineta steineri]|uniref:G-protein coupled receptors family 1 profile domain-containing protein n=1 Tax=Adineta steineri TaxID=433720 RepID=A0A815BEC1_9BILA|nr:unnamed protein product [Adineta steineri]CAF1272481.1 unnamed protein product [Adineta steineri]